MNKSVYVQIWLNLHYEVGDHLYSLTYSGVDFSIWTTLQMPVWEQVEGQDGEILE